MACDLNFLLINLTMSINTLRIATRKSPLALQQAHYIGHLLLQHWPTLQIEYLPLVTTGDRFLKTSLVNLGGKGLFVKELEEALLEGRADIAVHSMKDVPTTFPKGLGLGAICQRHSAFDALLSERYNSLSDLPEGACVGTASLRRQAQLLAHRPDLQIKPLRGNIQTRIAKLSAGDYDAIVLALAGLERMNLQTLVKEVLDIKIMLPACGQGALGIEYRITDEPTLHYLQALNDPISALCVQTERYVNDRLGGSCHVPLAVYASPTGNNDLLLLASVASLDGRTVISSRQQGPSQQATHLAEQCVQTLLAKGAASLLQHLS
jgi:hydroxymethylbilane synthase